MFLEHVWVVVLFGYVTSAEFTWLNRPGLVRACADGQATFPWHYDVTSTKPVTFFQWQFMKLGETVLQKSVHQNGMVDIVRYNYGEDRVELTDTMAANAGIILKKLDPDKDAGEYLVRLSGGNTDRAHLEVYTEEELEPRLEIGNSPVPFSSMFNMSDCERCVLVISTAQALTAHITMTTSGQPDVIECQNKTVCTKIINFHALTRGVTNIRFTVDYGFCDVKEKYVDLYWDGDDPNPSPVPDPWNDPDGGDSGGLTSKWEFILGLALGILGVLVIVLVVVVIILVKWLKRKQKKGDIVGQDSLTTKEKRVLDYVQRWKSVASRKPLKVRTVSRSRSCDPTVGSKVSDPEAVDIELLSRHAPEGNDVKEPMVDPEPAPVCEVHYHNEDPDLKGVEASENPEIPDGERPRPAGSSDVVELAAADENDIPVDIGEEVHEDTNNHSDTESSDVDRLQSIDSTASALKDFVVVPKH